MSFVPRLALVRLTPFFWPEPSYNKIDPIYSSDILSELYQPNRRQPWRTGDNSATLPVSILQLVTEMDRRYHNVTLQWSEFHYWQFDIETRGPDCVLSSAYHYIPSIVEFVKQPGCRVRLPPWEDGGVERTYLRRDRIYVRHRLRQGRQPSVAPVMS